MGNVYLDGLVAGGERLSESIHGVANRGLKEVIQNPEDWRLVRSLRIPKGPKGRRTALVAHDGKPVELRDVLECPSPCLGLEGGR